MNSIQKSNFRVQGIFLRKIKTRHTFLKACACISYYLAYLLAYMYICNHIIPYHTIKNAKMQYMIFWKLGVGGSKAVWNFSDNSSNLVARPFPYPELTLSYWPEVLARALFPQEPPAPGRSQACRPRSLAWEETPKPTCPRSPASRGEQRHPPSPGFSSKERKYLVSLLIIYHLFFVFLSLITSTRPVWSPL